MLPIGRSLPVHVAPFPVPLPARQSPGSSSDGAPTPPWRPWTGPWALPLHAESAAEPRCRARGGRCPLAPSHWQPVSAAPAPHPPRRPTCLLLTLEDSSNSSITEGPRTLSSAIHRFTDEKTQTLSVRGTRLRPHGKFVPGPGPHPRPSRPLPGATSPGSAALAAGQRLRPRRGLQRVGRTTDAPSRPPPPARASPVRRTCLSRQLARDSAHHEFSPAPPRTPESLLFQS